MLYISEELQSFHYISEELCNDRKFSVDADYDDVPVKDASSKVPIFSDMLNRGASFNWSETGQQSFRIMKKKLQEASWQ